MSPGRRYAVISWAKAYGIPIIEDDFESIVDPPLAGLRSLKSLDTRGVCTYIADLSRALMAGVAISYAIAPASIVEAAGRLVPSALPPVGEQLALAAFLRGNEFSRQIGRMRAVYTERREVLQHELRKQLGGAIISIERRGPLQVLVRLADDVRDVAVAEAAASLRLEVVPLSAVMPNEDGLILGYGGTSPDRLPLAVASLAEAFAAARERLAGHAAV